MIYKNFILSDKLGKLTPNQTGLFTPHHSKFYLTICILNTETGEKIKRRATYQYNTSATKYRAGDGLYAVASDALCFADCPGFHDFCLEFGYSVDAPKARGAYKACRASMAFFEKAGLDMSDIVAIRETLDA